MREQITDLKPNEDYEEYSYSPEPQKIYQRKTKPLHLKFLMIMLAGILGTSAGFMLADLLTNGHLEVKGTDIAKIVKSIKIFR